MKGIRSAVVAIPFVALAAMAWVAHAQPVSVSDGSCTSPDGTLATCLRDLQAVIDAGRQASLGEVANAVARRMDLEHDELIEARGCGRFIGTKAGDPPAGIQPPPTRTDCTIYVLAVLKEAFAAQGRTAEWNRVFERAQRTSGSGGFRGTELMKALQAELGWKGIFWAPDSTTEDARGEHRYAAYIARTKGTYYGLQVERDKRVVDYRPEDRSKTPDTANLEKLRRIPFGVLAAKGGMHMALILDGKVYEVHWADGCESTRLIEDRELESWGWNSGAIVAPAEDVAAAFGR